MDVLSAVVTLFLVMDPLGNVPLFLSVLKTVCPERRRIVLMREILFAYFILITFCSPAAMTTTRASSRSAYAPARQPQRVRERNRVADVIGSETVAHVDHPVPEVPGTTT